MAWDTKLIKRSNGDPVPQGFDVVADEYEVIHSTDNKLNVKASEVETLITTLNSLITAIRDTSGIKKITDAVNIGSSALPTGAATGVKQDTIISHVDELETVLKAIRDTSGIKKITDAVIIGSSALPTGAATSVKQDTIISHIDGVEANQTTMLSKIGEVQASPTANTVLARLKNLEGYVDGLEAGLGAIGDVEATGNGSLIGVTKQLRKLITEAYATIGAAIPTKGIAVAGSDGVNSRLIKTTENGEVLTQLTGSIVKRDTILNAVSVAAGAEQLNISLNLTGEESEVWILVNTDKQPWTLATNASNSGAIMGANISPIYPRRTNHASIYTSLNAPSTHLFYAFRLDATGTGISDPITLAEAKNLKLPPFEARFTFTNGHATDTATVTVRVLRRLR